MFDDIICIQHLYKELSTREVRTKWEGKTLLKQALLLSVGSLTNGLLITMRSKGKPIPEVLETVERVNEVNIIKNIAWSFKMNLNLNFIHDNVFFYAILVEFNISVVLINTSLPSFVL